MGSAPNDLIFVVSHVHMIVYRIVEADFIFSHFFHDLSLYNMLFCTDCALPAQRIQEPVSALFQKRKKNGTFSHWRIAFLHQN